MWVLVVGFGCLLFKVLVASGGIKNKKIKKKKKFEGGRGLDIFIYILVLDS